MGKTTISWSDYSWNPIAAYHRETGKRGWFCTKVSPGCTNCYAQSMNRWRGNGLPYVVKHQDDVRLELLNLDQPSKWKKPCMIFVCSMTDLFYEGHTDEMIDTVYAAMILGHQHIYQVLTKRIERARDYFAYEWRWPMIEGAAQKLYYEHTGEDPSHWLAVNGPAPNVWIGTSVEDQERADERIPPLMDIDAAVRFLSCEPLLGPIEIHELAMDDLHWVIVGGESGRINEVRPMALDWARKIIAQCREARIPVFYKQGGTANACIHDRKGGCLDCAPRDLGVREWPDAITSEH